VSAALRPAQVVDYWRRAGEREQWFSKDPAFDRDFHHRFLALHRAAAQQEFLRSGRFAG
jgi:uncharacterized protein (DUF924 family)